MRVALHHTLENSGVGCFVRLRRTKHPIPGPTTIKWRATAVHLNKVYPKNSILR
jgi:hypothetical protein